MADKVRISNIHFSEFKAFPKFSLHLDRITILVGPNNSGKSTIIGALRALGNGIRIAHRKAPERIDLGGTRLSGYRIPENSLPI